MFYLSLGVMLALAIGFLIYEKLSDRKLHSGHSAKRA